MNYDDSVDIPYVDSDPSHTHSYLWAPVLAHLASIGADRVFEIGCGNGAFARQMKRMGLAVTGVDPSNNGISLSKKSDPEIPVEVSSTDDPLSVRFGTFPVVISLEVVEHVYNPRRYAACVNELLEPGGVAIISTPYHSYIKNLTLALSGRMDNHFTALWDHGHIKFWSVRTLSSLFAEQNMSLVKTLRVGRVPVLAKSMILVFRKPS